MEISTPGHLSFLTSVPFSPLHCLLAAQLSSLAL